jgi:hypothetical protein
MLNAVSRAGATARASVPPTPEAEATAPGPSGAAPLQSAGGSLDGASEFTRALPSLRRARRVHYAAGDGGEDADAGATSGDATGVVRGGEQALLGALDSTRAEPMTTLELSDAGSGGGGQQYRAVPMPLGVQRYKGVSWDKHKGGWQGQHQANGMRMRELFPADQAAAAARFYDASVRTAGGTVVNFPRPGTEETAAEAPGAGDRERKEGPTPMPPGAQCYKGVSWSKNTGRWRAEHEANGVRMLKFFSSDQAAAAARAYDASVRKHGGTVVNFPRAATAETAAEPRGAGGRERKQGPTPMPPGGQRYKGVSCARQRADGMSDAGVLAQGKNTSWAFSPATRQLQLRAHTTTQCALLAARWSTFRVRALPRRKRSLERRCTALEARPSEA